MTHAVADFMQAFFSHYLPIQRGLSVNTVAAYRDATKLILRYVADHLKKSVDVLDIEDITEAVVLGFLDHVQQQRGRSGKTRNARLAAIRCLFAFVARQQPELLAQCRQIRAIPLKRTSQVSIDYLEEAELQALMDAVNLNDRTGVRDRALLLLLYNVPTIWHLDQRLLRDHAGLISAIDDFFSPLHRRLATESLTGFEWLTDDRLVQRTRFGDIVALTANFSGESYDDLPAMCIVADWLDEDRRERFCPADHDR